LKKGEHSYAARAHQTRELRGARVAPLEKQIRKHGERAGNELLFVIEAKGHERYSEQNGGAVSESVRH
jgi:hypothetical protein